MATELVPKIFEGPIGKEAVVVEAIAAGAIPLWSPVVLTSPGTGEDLPRVTTVNGLTGHVFGVAVGPKLASGNAADAAGDKVYVCVFGWCKVKVDGNAANIAIGDYLISHATGVAQKAAATGFPFAIAGAASTADGDIIPCFVGIHATVVV
jgi:hypothetical protein